ncbi:MAG: CD225/dispanin family protein [Nitriliruptor sp.]|uniref:CD225/dispanin family protein n=1 Tax=Nitriliruptor sp. TaxID=2448056 RepID=UPI0034A00C48
MSDQGGSGPVAGWYPDPEVHGGQRYWDGSRWGEQRPPASDPSGGWSSPDPSGGWGTGSPGAWGSPGGSPPSWQNAPHAGQGAWSQTTPAANVDPWLWQSIVATVLCCLPFGIVGIVKSTQAKSASDVGNAQLAQQRAGEARTWTLVAVGVGFVFQIGFFALGFGGAMAGF